MSRTIERTETDIEVNVIDFDELEEQLNNDDEFVQKVRENDDSDNEVIGITITESEHGWVEAKDKKGVFLIDKEAIVLEYPITEDEPVKIPVKPRYAKNEDGSRTIATVPASHIPLDDDAIRDFEVKERKNLKNFVRHFGSRIENNYEGAIKYLEGRVEVNDD